MAADFAEDPETYQKPLEKTLAAELAADPDLAAKLEGLLKQYEAAKDKSADARYQATISGSGSRGKSSAPKSAGERERRPQLTFSDISASLLQPQLLPAPDSLIIPLRLKLVPEIRKGS